VSAKLTSITETKYIDHAEFVQNGYGAQTVRMIVNGTESGFATTSYSFGMSAQVKEYSSERIFLLMSLAKGKSNAEIESILKR